jgi:hypothetical protein
MSIQRGTGKPLIIGESSHPDSIGYGAYMAYVISSENLQPSQKRSLMSEYFPGNLRIRENTSQNMLARLLLMRKRSVVDYYMTN